MQDWSTPTPEVQGRISNWIHSYRPDAILSTEWNIKLLLTGSGFRIPEDIALASTSIINTGGEVDSGMLESPEEVGSTAVRTLVGLIQRNEVGIPEHRHDILVRSRWQFGNTLPIRTPESTA